MNKQLIRFIKLGLVCGSLLGLLLSWQLKCRPAFQQLRPPEAPFDMAAYQQNLTFLDSVSLFIRLAEKSAISEDKMKAVLALYAPSAQNPRSLLEFVAVLEYRISFGHLEEVGMLLDRFKKYLHTYYGDERFIKKQQGYLFYYPYLMGRYLLAKGEYKRAAQYLNLALEFRSDYKGIAACDLLQTYEKLNRTDEIVALIKLVLIEDRDAPDRIFFRSYCYAAK